MTLTPAAFLSYVRSLDEHDRGALTKLSRLLSEEVHQIAGREFRIFQDREEIHWGENWKTRIDESLNATTFLIPIITPLFFTSEYCRKELTLFLDRERQLGRNDLILPIYYISTPLLEDKSQLKNDELAQAIAQHQYWNWRSLRHVPVTSPQARKEITKMSRQIGTALDRATSPAPQTIEPAIKQQVSSDTHRPQDDPITSEIRAFLARTRIERWFRGQFIEVFVSPECRGWKRDEVTHLYAGDYPCPPELSRLMERFPAGRPIREYFGLHRCPPLSWADDGGALVFELYGGTWSHVFALSAIFKNRADDKECREFREQFQDKWILYTESTPLLSSPLYHNVNAEVAVLSSDNLLILGKRHGEMLYGGNWSASIEEQMLRRDPEKPNRAADRHLFDAAERGVKEELGIAVTPEETRLLSVGVEWGNFTAAFLFLVRCGETYDEIVEQWKSVRHDPNEAVALDCIPATSESLRSVAGRSTYKPTARWVQRISVEEPEGMWHPTAVARLEVLADHLEHADKKG